MIRRVLQSWNSLLLLLGGMFLTENVCSSQSPPPSPVYDLPVTRGLIRWWPNLFDVHDEITGQEGVVMGLLPAVETGADDPTEFGRNTAWVQLKPAITNEVFTLAFWMVSRTNRPQLAARLLGQESAAGEWIFQTDRLLDHYFIGGDHPQEADWAEHIQLGPEEWRHLAIARRTNGTSAIWVNGKRILDGRTPHLWPGASRWLVVGNGLRGGLVFHGGLRDLCAFDRVLGDEEIGALHEAGLPRRPARNSPARLRATIQPRAVPMLTNQTARSSGNWTHRRFTTEDGLPGNVVNAVLQARNGYLWVGTEDGLARFDGRKFQAFTVENTPALKAIGPRVCSLAEDAEGTIWAGLFGGLLRMQGLKFDAFTNGLPQRYVLQVQPAGDGWVWVAGFNTTLPRGPCWLRRYHPASGTSSAAVVVPGHLRRLVMETNGLWLATEQPPQLHFWDGRSAATRVVAMIDDQAPRVLLGGSRLPTGTEARAWNYGAHGDWWVEIKLGAGGPAFGWMWNSRLNRPWAARWAGPASPEEGWLGVSYELARLRHGILEKVEAADFSEDQHMVSLCANREGGVWFGTEEDGLHFVQERLVRVYTARDGLEGNDVRSVSVTPDGNLWAATSRGLNFWQNGQWTLRAPRAMRATASDRQGFPWFSVAERGMHALNRLGPDESPIFLNLEWQDPSSLRFGRDGTLWIACERGLTWLKPEGLIWNVKDRHWYPDPTRADPVFGRYAIGQELPPAWPLGLVEDREGWIWMGSLKHGLFRVKNGQVKVYTEQDGLPGNLCAPVYLDHSGALWMVTGSGLTRWTEGRFQSIGDQHGLPKDLLLDLIEDDLGHFWISGKRGIHRVARREIEEVWAGRLARVQSLTLGLQDGLLTPECSSLYYPSMAKTPDQDIWVATRNGLARFDPHRVRLDTRPLSTLIEHVVVNRREVPLRPSARCSARAEPGNEEVLLLPPGSGQRLEFHYTAISLAQADRIKFRYRLEGHDKDWSPETELRLAFYTNLRPGPYCFRVKAANTHGIWNEADTTLPFRIEPYFWQRPLFQASAAGLFLASILGAHRHRLREHKRLQELKHQQALMNEKTRIAADLHDELGARLTQLAILGEVAKSQADNASQMRSTLNRISEAARELTARMSDLVWATNPRNDALDNLAAYLREHAASQLENSALQARLDFPASLPDCHLSATFRRNLLLVMQEALHNVVKHSQATEVSVLLQADRGELRMRIQDNGRGFKPSKRNGSGNGLTNMKKRIGDLGGEWRLSSAPGQGTGIEIRIRLPENGR